MCLFLFLIQFFWGFLPILSQHLQNNILKKCKILEGSPNASIQLANLTFNQTLPEETQLLALQDGGSLLQRMESKFNKTT